MHTCKSRGRETPATTESEAGKVLDFVLCFPFFLWWKWGSYSWEVIAGTSVQLNHGLAHGFGGLFFFPCSNTIVGFLPLTVSRIHLKGEGQKAQTKLTSIPTGRIPPFPGIPHGEIFFASFALT